MFAICRASIQAHLGCCCVCVAVVLASRAMHQVQCCQGGWKQRHQAGEASGKDLQLLLGRWRLDHNRAKQSPEQITHRLRGPIGASTSP